MKTLFTALIALFSLSAFAAEDACSLAPSQEAIVSKLFSGKSHIYSLLWWNDPNSKIINARSFIINGHDSVPIFPSEAEGKRQVAGSGYEKDLVGVDPALLAAILQKMEFAVLNPGDPSPMQFRTCALKPYAKVK